MRIIKFAFIFVFLGAALSCGPKDGVKTIRTGEKLVADFGTIKEIDGKVQVRLLAKNEFKDTLYPVQIYTPCGCTDVNFSRKPVAPGEDEVLLVEYNPAYRPGEFMEEIQVYYSNSPTPMRSFLIKGKVIGFLHPIEEDRPYHMGEGLYQSHKIISYGGLREGATGDVFFRYGNGNKKSAEVTYSIPEEFRPYVRWKQPGRMKADERDTIHVRFTYPAGMDTVQFYVQPMVNGKPTLENMLVRAWRRE